MLDQLTLLIMFIHGIVCLALELFSQFITDGCCSSSWAMTSLSTWLFNSAIVKLCKLIYGNLRVSCISSAVLHSSDGCGRKFVIRTFLITIMQVFAATKCQANLHRLDSLPEFSS